jgi:hypothetical protein
MKKVFLLFFVVLAGCASAKQVTGPNGKIAYLVQCGNAVKSTCAEKAIDICPHGFNELDRSAYRNADLTEVGKLGVLEIKANTTTSMLLQCK